MAPQLTKLNIEHELFACETRVNGKRTNACSKCKSACVFCGEYKAQHKCLGCQDQACSQCFIEQYSLCSLCDENRQWQISQGMTPWTKEEHKEHNYQYNNKLGIYANLED